MKQKLLFCLILLGTFLLSQNVNSQSVFINEFHYDNEGGDVNEALEIAGPEGINLDGYTIALYNGNGGGVYQNISLTGTIPNKQGGYGMLSFNYAGIQNGADAFALVDPSGSVLQFISYEGSFMATDGPANGMESIDVMVEESGSTPINFSLQLEGEGQVYTDFSWVAPATATFDEINNNQDFGGEIVDPETDPEPLPEPATSIVFINEFHYDNAGGDVGEGIEIAGTAGTDLSAYSIVFYNGNDQEADDTIQLNGVLEDQNNGYGTMEFLISGIQNGAPDGFALIRGEEVIQFLSYEGSFIAADGPAAGIESTDVGVEETSSTAVGFSLQLKGEGSFYENFEWAEAASNTFGTINNEQTFISPEPIVFVNELHYDNASGDTGEGLEIAGTAGTDLSAYSLVFYNGSDQEADDTVQLSGTLPNLDNGYGVLEFFIAGIQNGSPDGFALIKGEEVIQFLSYEGTFIAIDGPAAGLESTDIGVAESGSTPRGYSLQLSGEGKSYEDFVWAEASSNTFGAINTAQSFGGEVVTPEPEPEITEPITIAEARALDLGKKVIVEGILTTTSQFGNTAYIQDNTGGMAIFGDLVTEEGLYQIGDSLRVTGVRAEYNELIQISDLEKVEYLGVAQEPIVAKKITLSQLEDHRGQLIEITDMIFPEPGQIFFGNSNYEVSDVSGSAQLRIDSDVKELVGKTQPEICASVVGIVARYQDINQLQPRNQVDLPCAEEFNPVYAGSDISKDLTIDATTWNIEWFGDESNSPAAFNENSDQVQKEAVKEILLGLDSDIIAVQEISDEVLFAEMISEMEGYDYILSQATSYPDSPGGQKLGFVYKTETVTVNSSRAMFTSLHPFYEDTQSALLTDYPDDVDRFFASGRLPFIMNATVKVNGSSQDINFVALHARANTGSDQPQDYAKRKYDVEVLKDSLDANYAMEKIMILGDYNDDVDETVADGVIPAISSYIAFKNDAENYTILSEELSEQGFRSTVSYPNMIDHIAASNEIASTFIVGSARVHYEFYDSDYSYTASDHFPVSVRLQSAELQFVSLETTPVLCAGTATASATVNVEGGIAPYNYIWSNGGDSETITGLAAGDYSVEVTDQLGNSVSAEFTIDEVTPIEITMIEDQSINIGYLNESVVLEPAMVVGGTGEYTYQWNTGESARSIRVSPESTTTYTLTVNDANGCSSSTEITVNVTDVSCGKKGDKIQICHNGNSICVSPNAVPSFLRRGAKLGICNNKSEMLVEEIVVSPNPVRSETIIRISGAKAGKALMSVYDINGNLRLTQKIKLSNGDSDYQLNLSNFISGVYILEITDGKLKSQPIKIIKK